MDETPYVETLEPGGSGGSPDGAGGSKLPPVLANLMGSMGAGKSPQGPGGGINVQEILTSIMVRESSSSREPPTLSSESPLLFTLLGVSSFFVFVVFSFTVLLDFNFVKKSHCVAQGGQGQPAPCAWLIPVPVFHLHAKFLLTLSFSSLPHRVVPTATLQRSC